MAYIVGRRNGTWEVREATATPKGPRSRTLATFRSLSPEVIEHARERSGTDLRPETVRRLARRAGAPVDPAPADAHAAALIHALTRGSRPRRGLRLMLAHALRTECEERLSRDFGGAADWVGASLEHRGAALRDLLGLADALPQRRRPRTLSFPRLDSRAR